MSWSDVINKKFDENKDYAKENPDFNPENINPKERIDLKKNAKGDYQWEIKVLDEDITTQLKKLEEIDNFLRERYGEKKENK